ncbi:MAG TPA: chaperone modulator CbpM [Salinisphaeraceae bacterium]|nr:chaperone modulator CbpM [Salinisphaeraceae bacterium]
MVADNQQIAECQVIGQQETVSLGQLCRSCGVHAEWVTLLVEHGIIEPENEGRAEAWQFRTMHLRRVHTALHLQQDLDLNVPGIALALELMDQIEDLRRRLDMAG